MTPAFAGTRGRRCDAEKALVHDFLSDASGKAIPHGVYDMTCNEVWASVGCGHDTPAFAVPSMRRWRKMTGNHAHPDAEEPLITADAGGGNGYRSRAWKSENWRGKLLTTFETIVDLIGNTRTAAGCSGEAQTGQEAEALAMLGSEDWSQGMKRLYFVWLCFLPSLSYSHNVNTRLPYSNCVKETGDVKTCQEKHPIEYRGVVPFKYPLSVDVQGDGRLCLYSERLLKNFPQAQIETVQGTLMLDPFEKDGLYQEIHYHRSEDGEPCDAHADGFVVEASSKFVEAWSENKKEKDQMIRSFWIAYPRATERKSFWPW